MISIAMATYNGEPFLERQLLSLSEQLTPPSELVICDDGSTDGTIEIIHRFARSASFPVRFFANTTRLGWKANFLKAASLCASDYIAFCDQDDIWLKHKCSVVSQYLDGNPYSFLQHGYRLIDSYSNVISGDLDNSDVERDAPWRHSRGLTQVFHRSFLAYSDLWDLSQDHFVDNQKMGHEQWIHFLAQLFGTIISIDDVLVYYRQHDTNTVGFGRVDRSINFVGTLKTNLSRLYNKEVFDGKRGDLVKLLRWRKSASSSRARVIELLLPRIPPAYTDRFSTHLQYYQSFWMYQSHRLQAYDTASRTGRLNALASNCRQGLYQAAGKQGARDFVLDTLYGVMK
jgi:glycosyltransferase involved in cell wall biosynthesis